MKNRHRRFVRLVLFPAMLLNIVIYCVAVMILQPQTVFAQAYVIGSDPVDGSTVTAAPGVLRIYFNANISALSVVQVSYVKSGDYVPIQTRNRIATTNPRELDTDLPNNLAGGSYFVRWTVVANDDGRTTFGSIGFNVGRSSTGIAGTATLGPQSSNQIDGVGGSRTLDLVGVLAVAWEWLVLAALTFWIGILVTERLILIRVERVADLLDRARRQSLPLQWLCVAALLVGEIVTLVLRGVHVTRGINTIGAGSSILNLSTLPALLTETLYGYFWLARFVLIILALALLWQMTRRRPEGIVEQVSQRVPGASRTGPLRLQQAGLSAKTTGTIKTMSGSLHTTQGPLQRYTSLWLLLACLIIGTYALTENAVGVIQPHISAIVLSGLSLLAQSVWFGGLAYLGYVVLPLLSIVDLDSNAETIVAFLRRITPFVIGSIGIQVVSLLFLSETTIHTPNVLLDDPYGRSLLVRLVLVALTLLASMYVLFILCPKLARQSALLTVVNVDLPARRRRQSTLEHTTRHVKTMLNLQGLLGASILLCAALMSFYAPPIVFPKTSYASSPALATTTPSDTTQQQKVGDFTVGLQVSPGRVTSANTIIVSITDAQGKSITNAKVQLISNMQTMDMGTAIKKATTKSATYVATFAQGEAFSMTGLWHIEIRFQLPGQPIQKVSFQVTVG